MNDIGDLACPVPLELLGRIHRANPTLVGAMVSHLSQDTRARLAFYCYGKAHLRDAALAIAAECDEERLGQLAGTLGQVLAAQCRARVASFGKHYGDRTISRPTVSLAGRRRLPDYVPSGQEPLVQRA